ncbi:hypothetical protein Tco_0634707 [Tanacetum coccineum]
MNQNFYNSNASGFDQFQPPQFLVIHQPPQAMSTEMLQARENLMEAIQAFLKEYDHIPPKEKPIAFLLAEDKFLKIKQAIEEKRATDQEEQEDRQLKVLSIFRNFPMIDDDEHTILYRSSKAITPDLPTKETDNSLSMGDEHPNTIPETESDEVIKSSVETSSQSQVSPRDYPDFEDSRALGFVHLFELHILSFI